MNDQTKAIDPLESAKYMLERADKHIAEFKREAEAFRDSKPTKTVHDVDPETSWRITKVRLTKSLPATMPGILFDALGNLRSCLDQIGYATAKAADPAFGRWAQFPFGTDFNNAKSLKGGSSKHIPETIFDLMLSFGPYETGNRTLWAINKLCNTKKHRSIINAWVRPSGIHIDKIRSSGKWTAPGQPRWDPERQEIEVLRSEPGAQFHEWKVRITLYVGFSDVAGLEGAPVIETLIEMRDVVGRILTAVEAEAIRLGLFKQ